MDQNPPRDMPRTTRPSRTTLKPGASATIKLDNANKSDNDRTTVLRLSLRVKNAIKRLVTTARMEVAVTAWPASPSLMPRSFAIGVSMPAGKNSAIIKPETPMVRAQTAFQSGALFFISIWSQSVCLVLDSMGIGRCSWLEDFQSCYGVSHIGSTHADYL